MIELDEATGATCANPDLHVELGPEQHIRGRTATYSMGCRCCPEDTVSDTFWHGESIFNLNL
jgi:hypothetical protein